MTKFEILETKKPASDPEIIDYLRALLRIAIKHEIEWIDIRGYALKNQHIDFYWPELTKD